MEITCRQSSYESVPEEFISRYYWNQKYCTLEGTSLKLLLLSLCEELSWIFPKHTDRFSRTHLPRLPHCLWFCSPFILSCFLLIVFWSWWYILRICFSFVVCEHFDAGKTSCVLLLCFVWRMYYLKYTATLMLSKAWL